MADSTTVRNEAIIDLLSEHRRPMHAGELAARLGVPARHRLLLHDRLEELVFDGVLQQLPGRRYRLLAAATERREERIEGVIAINPRGFGFINSPTSSGDLHLAAHAVAGAMHGDTVRARVVSRTRRGLEGEVVGVVSRARTRVGGTLRCSGRGGPGKRQTERNFWLEPDDQRIRGPIPLLPPWRDGRSHDDEPATMLHDGLAAVVAIVEYPEYADENPVGRLLKIVGEPGDPAAEVAKLLLAHGIEDDYPPDAAAQARQLAVAPGPQQMTGREDLTDVPLITIDPADARDHDDAVWVQAHEQGGYTAWIAIADVSHYVRPNTALDDEALARGNSVYLPDRAIAMLPHELSAGSCSLVPGELRLCMCVQVQLTARAVTRQVRIVEAFMRSRAKLSYENVARALGFTGAGQRDPEAERWRHDLRVMWELATRLRRRRLRRGALDLDIPETRIIIDPRSGEPQDVLKRTHDPGVRKAYQLVEELMLLANESCAQLLAEQHVPTIYRIHAEPDHEKLEAFLRAAKYLGVDVAEPSAEELGSDPQLLGQLIAKLDEHPKRQVLHTLLLRAMQQACYSTENVGHFGLASPCYLHFTSPIRRYADLAVHRMLRAMLRAGEQRPPTEALADDWWERRGGMSGEQLSQAATAASERERAALDVERAVADLYRAAYMRQHLGETFVGTVVAAANHGAFVQLDHPFVDVLVKRARLGPEDYELDESGLALVGLRSGHRIEVGDSLTVQIEDVSIGRRLVFGRRLFDRSESADRSRRRRTRSERTGKGAGEERSRHRSSRSRSQRESGHQSKRGRVRKRARTRRRH